MLKKILAPVCALLIMQSTAMTKSTEKITNPTAKTKHLVLHFDVNNTIVALDTVQGKDLDESVTQILAEYTSHAWDGTQELSYFDYLTSKIEQENPHVNPSDQLLKDKRRDALAAFPKHLQQHYPQLYATFEQEKAQMLKVLQAEHMVIFPSFFKVLQWLNDNHPNNFTIYLRTFGKDLPDIIPLIQKKSQLRFTDIGRIEQGKHLVLGTEKKLATEFFARADGKHHAFSDDYWHWRSTGFKATGGKPFLADVNNSAVLTIFFDDNAKDLVRPIINPIGKNGETLDTHELLKSGHIVAVNSKDAILDEDYFINKIKAMLA